MVRIGILSLILLFLSGSTVPPAQNVEIHVKGIRSGNGTIRIGVFTDQESFEREVPSQRIILAKTGLSNQEIVSRVSLGPGVYGLSILDDESGNEKMDFNFIGIPLEGFGFSNYYHTGFSKPQFDKFKFQISGGEMKQVEIRVRYM
ncbi:MAG: DUF2141 domain-containing protein [Bacteroidetes bacterium]|nr:MAG: DUF2141 domain-containing protein [Bacteroidota bacterium]